MTTTINQPKDFVILGPTLAPGNKALEAIHALYYLPDNYKLVFADDADVDQAFYNQAVLLVQRNGLNGRVRFFGKAPSSQAVIVPNGQAAGNNSISGDSSEALASAILNVARSTA